MCFFDRLLFKWSIDLCYWSCYSYVVGPCLQKWYFQRFFQIFVLPWVILRVNCRRSTLWQVNFSDCTVPTPVVFNCRFGSMFLAICKKKLVVLFVCLGYETRRNLILNSKYKDFAADWCRFRMCFVSCDDGPPVLLVIVIYETSWRNVCLWSLNVIILVTFKNIRFVCSLDLIHFAFTDADM